MTGHLLLADGLHMTGTLVGAQEARGESGPPASGWLVANTAVVGFQEMATDPAYRGCILAFTYPEVGSVGIVERFNESAGLQIAGMVVKALSDYTSHYLCEYSFASLLAREGVACLSGIDTRGLAVHLREKGEMPAAIAPEGADLDKIGRALAAMQRPQFKPTAAPAPVQGKGSPAGQAPKLAVVNLGLRRSDLRQLAQRCGVTIFPHEASPGAILKSRPAGLFVSDGPGSALPPEQTVETLAKLLGQLPVLACGLGHVALGMALGCQAEFLTRGHHGANYPLRSLLGGQPAVTQQRHSVTLTRRSVTDNPRVKLAWENMTDGTVEGIVSADGSARGYQPILAEPEPGAIHPHVLEFVESLKS